jgi:hypothetical protein
VRTVSGGIFRCSPPVAVGTAVPPPVPTSAPTAAPVPSPVIPLHALSLPLCRVEAGRNCHDTLMHEVGDQHFIGVSIVAHHNRPSWCILRVLRFTRALGHRNGVLKT